MASVIKQTTRKSCPFCSLPFSCRSSFRKHTKKKHPEESKENSLDKGLIICRSCSDALKLVQNTLHIIIKCIMYQDMYYNYVYILYEI